MTYSSPRHLDLRVLLRTGHQHVQGSWRTWSYEFCTRGTFACTVSFWGRGPDSSEVSWTVHHGALTADGVTPQGVVPSPTLLEAVTRYGIPDEWAIPPQDWAALQDGPRDLDDLARLPGNLRDPGDECLTFIDRQGLSGAFYRYLRDRLQEEWELEEGQDMGSVEILGTTGDRHPYDHSGGVVFRSRESDTIAWESWEVEEISDDDRHDAQEVLVHQVDLPDDVLGYHDWCRRDLHEAAAYRDLPPELLERWSTGTVADRMALLEVLASYYGVHEFDHYPRTMTVRELRRRWGRRIFRDPPRLIVSDPPDETDDPPEDP